MPHVTTIVTKMRFVGSHSQVYHDIFHNRPSADFISRCSFHRSIAMVFNETTISLFYLTRLISHTQKQELQTSGFSSEPINHSFNKTLLVFRYLFTRSTHHKSDRQTMLTGLSDNLLKSGYHVGLKKMEEMNYEKSPQQIQLCIQYLLRSQK